MKVELNDDSLPKGTELAVHNLGTLINGKAVEFDDETVAAFEAASGQKLASAFKGDSRISVSSSSSKKEGGE